MYIDHLNDKLEEKMDLVRDLISLGRFAREESKIKVRQPISKVIINGKYKPLIKDIINLIEEELNVKEVVFENDLSQYMNFNVLPNYKEAGKIFGSNIKEYANYLSNISDEDLNKINSYSLDITLNGTTYNINKDLIEVRITSKEGYNAQMENDKFIILDTNLTKELIHEGVARELVSKVQQLRKTNNYNVIDRINIYYDSNDEFEEVLKEFNDYIKNDTLAINIIKRYNRKIRFKWYRCRYRTRKSEDYKNSPFI